jgi:hypothetical protein
LAKPRRTASWRARWRVLGDIDELAAAIVALARIALGIFVGHDRALRLEHGAGHDVLRGDQLDLVLLAAELCAFAVWAEPDDSCSSASIAACAAAMRADFISVAAAEWPSPPRFFVKPGSKEPGQNEPAQDNARRQKDNQIARRKGDPSGMANGSDKAAASVTAPRTPATEVATLILVLNR